MDFDASPGASPAIIDSPAAARRINRRRVLEVISLQGPLTRPEVVKRSGLSKATVREVCDLLLAENVLREEPPTREEPRRPGRPAARLSFQGVSGHVLGLDIGAGKVLALVSDLGGRILSSAQTRLPAHSRPHRDAVLAVVEQTVREVFENGGLDRSSVLGVVAGTPGVVAPADGAVTLAPQIEGWDGIHLASELSGLLDLETKVESEVHLAVVGERWRGAAHDQETVAFLQLGVGIAAGIVIDGVLLRGANGGAGEIGYLPADSSRPPNDCGPFEWMAGGRAFARAGREAISRGEGPVLLELCDGDPTALDARMVFTAAGSGEASARLIIDVMAERIARGVATLACVVNPATVVVGGGLSNAGAVLLDPIRTHLEQLVPLPPRLVQSQLGEHAVAYGAVRMALGSVHAQLELPSTQGASYA